MLISSAVLVLENRHSYPDSLLLIEVPVTKHLLLKSYALDAVIPDQAFESRVRDRLMTVLADIDKG